MVCSLQRRNAFSRYIANHKDLNNLKIFPINVGQDNVEKATKFFKDLEIKNLKYILITNNFS